MLLSGLPVLRTHSNIQQPQEGMNLDNVITFEASPKIQTHTHPYILVARLSGSTLIIPGGGWDLPSDPAQVCSCLAKDCTT